MRTSRWLDHLSPWVAWGALVSTEVYEPLELAWMALPLSLAALAEWRRWELSHWRRPMEVAALVALLIQAWARIGLVPTTVNTLFLLCAIRLALPRELPQRRQILLMAFLLFLTTSVSTTELPFAFWSVLFMVSGGMVLMHQAWEPSASLRPGPLRPPPFGHMFRWAASVILIAGTAFVAMPRLTMAVHPFPWGVPGLTSARAGLSDRLTLGDKGPILPSGEVALRIQPRQKPEDGTAPDAAPLALLKGITLEDVEGQRWTPALETPSRSFLASEAPGASISHRVYDFFVAPDPRGIIPLPQGSLKLVPPPGASVRSGPGASIRWSYPSGRTLPITVVWQGPEGRSPQPSARRLARLLDTGQHTEAALRWSRRVVPDDPSPRELARRLSTALLRFRYTLDNPSGRASNPLEDFLERSRAGHCEYFASSLALMLRHRGVPARVVNGYRLGPWIGEGGYWVVTRNEAHSWVEFYDEGAQRWITADPTPAAPPTGLYSPSLTGVLQRWMDSLRFRWERYVVRFSDADQVAGLEWMREKTSGLLEGPVDRRIPWIAGIAALLAFAAWHLRRFRSGRPGRSASRPPGGIPALKPLLRATRSDLPGQSWESARTWLSRLAVLKPERAESLARLADEADRVGYGGAGDRRLRHLVKAERKAWKQ